MLATESQIPVDLFEGHGAELGAETSGGSAHLPVEIAVAGRQRPVEPPRDGGLSSALRSQRKPRNKLEFARINTELLTPELCHTPHFLLVGITPTGHVQGSATRSSQSWRVPVFLKKNPI